MNVEFIFYINTANLVFSTWAILLLFRLLVLCQKPGSLRVLCLLCWGHPSCLGGQCSLTTGTTYVLSLHNFSISSFGPLVLQLLALLLSWDCYIYLYCFLCSLPIITMSGWSPIPCYQPGSGCRMVNPSIFHYP